MKELRDMKEIYNRANKIKHDGSYFVIFSKDSGIYLEVSFSTQVLLIGGDSGIGKTWLMKTLRDMKRNNYNIDVCSESCGLSSIEVILNPQEIYVLDARNSEICFIDRGDMLEEGEKEVLNRYIKRGGAVVIFARGISGIHYGEIAPFDNRFDTNKVEGITCFYLS